MADSDPEPFILPEYRDNPFIARLPSLLSTREAYSALTALPLLEERERQYPDHIRAHCIARLLRYFEPLEQHLQLEERFSILVRQGYIGRDPSNGNYLRHLQNSYARVENNDWAAGTHAVTNTATSFALVGSSGVGKSKSFERILSLYPQVIYHTEPFSLLQIVWLKLDCPYKGSHKQLCINFFSEVDRLLGTRYLAKFGAGRLSADEMMGHMAHVASLHALGVLVIDEIQNIGGGTNDQDLMAFLVRLVNTIATPVVVVGTPSALPVLQKNFREARRASGLGAQVWERMQPGRSWDHFVGRLWHYQWVREPIPLDDELRHVLYDESQGVVDIVVKLFMLAQIHAIKMGTVRKRPERLDAKLIRQVAKQDFQLIQPMIQALRSNDVNALAKYDDLRPLHLYVQDVLVNAQQSSPANYEISSVTPAGVGGTTSATGEEAVISALCAMGIAPDVVQSVLSDALKANPGQEPLFLLGDIVGKLLGEKLPTKAGKVKRRVKDVPAETLNSKDLRRIVADGKAAGMSAYDALRAQSVIKPPLEDLAA